MVESKLQEIPGYGHYKPNDSWLRCLARNAGFYKYPHEIEHEDECSMNRFEKLVKSDDPKSVCTPLLVEEYRCLNEHHFHTDPETASTKCVKWYNEWLQCKWDEEKMRFGYNYIEGRPSRKHKAYIAAPNYQYS